MPNSISERHEVARLPLPQDDPGTSHDGTHFPDTFSEDPGRHPLKVLQQAFSATRRRRRDYKTTARGYVASALNFTQAGDQIHACAQWKNFIAHCEKAHLNVEHELARATPHSDHPLTQMLDREDYGGIALLVPSLKTAVYGSTLVKRTEDGVYVGQSRGSRAMLSSMVAEGRGVCFEANGRRTQGTWRDHQPATVCDFPSSGAIEEYNGQMLNHRYHGRGTAHYKNGDIFAGDWRDGRRDGEGTLTMSSGDLLQAQWRTGVMQPGAHFETKDGRIYRGDFNLSAGLPQGKVTVMWSRGRRLGACYDGFVDKGQPQGVGKYIFGVSESLSGYSYDGPWWNGKKQGCGVLTRQIDHHRMSCAFVDGVLQDLSADKQFRLDARMPDEADAGIGNRSDAKVVAASGVFCSDAHGMP